MNNCELNCIREEKARNKKYLSNATTTVNE